MHANSLAANDAGREGLFSKRAREILAVYRSKREAMTDRDVMRALGFQDPNKVRPRITELVDLGALVEVGCMPCPETKKPVRLVVAPNAVTRPLQTQLDL